MEQQGVEGTDGRYIRADGSVPLTANWAAGGLISVARITATQGGVITLGEELNRLRLSYETNEIMKLVGISNNLGELNMKNSTIEDLAGVGVRAVLADVNGKLSAP